MNCIRIVVSGKVQGVAFRHFAKTNALELGINGTARNLPNDKVEIMAQGEKERLEKFISILKKGPERAVVENISFEQADCAKKFEGFEIAG